MSGDDIITRLLRIHGRVQGVGYRMWAEHTAKQCRVTGWVRNRLDGSVEILAHGVEDDMARFINECFKGPKGAEVKEILTSLGADEDIKEFQIRDNA
jgi:acylphosphatase